jgi:alkylated DNA repair protein alkB homolog 1
MPPQAICNLYKKYQKMDDESVDEDLSVVDFRRGLTFEQKEKIVPVDIVCSEIISSARKAFESCNGDAASLESDHIPEACTIYGHRDFDGQFTSLLSTSEIFERLEF